MGSGANVILFFYLNMKKADILLIDDDTLFLFLTEKTLGKVPEQLNIHSISKIEEARAYLESRASNKEQFPDAIFVDLNMPGMSGMEFADYYNRQYAPHFPDTKLVMLTSSISRKEKAKAMEIPAVKDFLQKPLTIEKLNRLLV